MATKANANVCVLEDFEIATIVGSCVSNVVYKMSYTYQTFEEAVN